MSGILIALKTYHWDCWELDLIGAIIGELSCVDNATSISLIFVANVSLFTSTTKIRGALNGLDSLMIGWYFGLSEIPIVVVKFEPLPTLNAMSTLMRNQFHKTWIPKLM